MSSNLVKGMKSFLPQKIKDDAKFAENFCSLVIGLASLPQNIRDFSEESAAKGWFFTSESFMGNMKEAYDKGQEKLDSYMIQEIDFNYIKIKKTLLQNHQNREHILSVAFDLHEKSNWIACIP